MEADIMLPSENNGLDKGPNRNPDQNTIIYLACPYTHPDPSVREKRFRLTTDAAAQLIRQGYIVYSAITMTHPLDVVLAGGTNTLGSDYWVQFDEAFMAVCTEMVVLQIEGWEQSRGIQREIDYFQNRGKPVRFLPAKGAELGEAA
jgi:hypothetical protein